MPEFTSVGKSEEVGDGQVTGYQVGEHAVAVARVSGALYAFSDICTHRQCNLSASEPEGTTIECECHGSMFDFSTGEVLNGPATDPIATFEVREEDGEIRVEV